MPLKILIMLMLLFSVPAISSAAPLQEATFKNGVKLIVEEDHSAPVAMVQIWLKVGGRDEVPGKTGLAHVFEHMMFKGSKKLAPGEYSRRISAMGGNDNAFTTTDYTAYFETIPADRVDEVLGLEAERFANLALRDEDFQKEIRVIMEERRMRTEDDPNSHMFEELSAASLRLHPYRNPVIGWMQDLKALTIEDVRAFYKKHYVPGNATVVVVGDVDFARVEKTVARTFGRMRARDIEARFNPVEPEPFGPKRIQVKLPAQLPMLAITIPVPVWQPGKNDREMAALAVATHILAGGRSARLQRELVDEQRRAFAASAGYDPFSMGLDLWYVYGMLGPKQTTAAFEKSLWALLADMKTHPVAAAPLAAAKRNMIAAEVFAQDSLYLRAKEIGRMEVSGIGADHRDQWLQAIGNVTAADVQAAVSRWLKQDRSTTGILTPEVKS
ncbi:MAG: peptidase M16 [Zetaproteobacteria bacterium CG12_big_fil_rev_8_21_14_0_65_54_13]|nr:MAG: peptidase M16 [Zetaproteobacteria bacterium CG12_big_fil_rev_8_21_14_0_65_54_13]PIX54519.1 MAG: peptidase M16 [Zetaproteobacteria bacterium CG_4_10_14_3_um_filter_54_28]PJA28693.1 MAG: peptidase M16 [Zetaproteobacteria bacterium CG_4_9_14_3_um_filter_54_145]